MSYRTHTIAVLSLLLVGAAAYAKATADPLETENARLRTRVALLEAENRQLKRQLAAAESSEGEPETGPMPTHRSAKADEHAAKLQAYLESADRARQEAVIRVTQKIEDLNAKLARARRGRVDKSLYGVSFNRNTRTYRFPSANSKRSELLKIKSEVAKLQDTVAGAQTAAGLRRFLKTLPSILQNGALGTVPALKVTSVDSPTAFRATILLRNKAVIVRGMSTHNMVIRDILKPTTVFRIVERQPNGMWVLEPLTIEPHLRAFEIERLRQQRQTERKDSAQHLPLER